MMKPFSIIFSLLLLMGNIYGTNGYFSIGHGIKSKGRAGTSTAYADEAFGGANNPASMVYIGTRNDIDLTLFSPHRKASRRGETAAGGIYNFSSFSKRDYFLIPEMGFNYNLTDWISLGVTAYANGGMNTSYVSNNKVPGSNDNPASCGTKGANLLLGCGELGIDFMQMVIAPTIAIRVGKFAIGASPLLTYQRFEAKGLQAFAPLSKYPQNLTNQGHDNSFGIGGRFGMMAKPFKMLTIGASYATETLNSPFTKYKGLFAEGGRLNVPSNFSVGFKLDPFPRISLGFDFRRIFYHSVPAVGNRQSVSLVNPSRPLGKSTGSGFHWRNQNVYKVGVEYTPIDALVLRVGWNYGKSPIRNGIEDITFNILAPAATEHHLAFGADYNFFDGRAELKFFYFHGFSNTVTGPSVLATIGIPGTETITLFTNSFGLGFGWNW